MDGKSSPLLPHNTKLGTHYPASALGAILSLWVLSLVAPPVFRGALTHDGVGVSSPTVTTDPRRQQVPAKIFAKTVNTTSLERVRSTRKDSAVAGSDLEPPKVARSFPRPPFLISWGMRRWDRQILHPIRTNSPLVCGADDH